jgi:hypothetical protein
LENLIKVEIQDKTVLYTKGTKLIPKLSTDMVSHSRKLLFQAYFHQFLTQNSRKGCWQPRGILGEWEWATEMGGGTAYLLGKFTTNSLTEQRTSGNPSVRPVVFAHWSRWCLVRPGITQMVLQKVAYVQWSHVRPLYFLQSVRSVASSHIFALQIAAHVHQT